MKKYKVQQMAQIWYEVEVMAEDREDAYNKGTESLARADGYEVDHSFTWEDETFIEEVPFEGSTE